MTNVPVVENPRRRRKRGRYTPAQKRAGFAGRASMRRRRTPRRRRQANPALATYSNPRPRKRRRRPVTYRTYRRHYGYRRRRNPSLRGLTRMLNLHTAASVAGGIFVARMTPGLVARVWAGAPVSGVGGMAVKVGGVLIAATVAKTVFRSDRIAVGLVAGGIGYILFDLAEEYLLPRLGLSLSGYGNHYRYGELENMGISGYEGARSAMAAYQPGTETVDSVLAV